MLNSTASRFSATELVANERPATDSELLSRIRSTGSERAFRMIVTHHGPMVLGVCRSMLDREDDIIAAFQAVFYILLRRSKSLRGNPCVAAWLHRVAYKVAARKRGRSLRKGYRFPWLQALKTKVNSVQPAAILHLKLAKLPQIYSEPLVLCLLKGCTREEAVRRLRYDPELIQSRLNRGMELVESGLRREDMELWEEGEMVQPSLNEYYVRKAFGALRAYRGRDEPDSVYTMLPSAKRIARRELFRMRVAATLRVVSIYLLGVMILLGVFALALPDQSKAALGQALTGLGEAATKVVGRGISFNSRKPKPLPPPDEFAERIASKTAKIHEYSAQRQTKNLEIELLRAKCTIRQLKTGTSESELVEESMEALQTKLETAKSALDKIEAERRFLEAEVDVLKLHRKIDQDQKKKVIAKK